MADLYTIEELAAYLQVPVESLDVATVDLIRELVTMEIILVVGQARFDATDPLRFKGVALEMSKRQQLNPGGLRSEQESIDDYNHSQTYATETVIGPGFTEDEKRRIRRAAGLRGAFTIVLGGRP